MRLSIRFVEGALVLSASAALFLTGGVANAVTGHSGPESAPVSCMSPVGGHSGPVGGLSAPVADHSAPVRCYRFQEKAKAPKKVKLDQQFDVVGSFKNTGLTGLFELETQVVAPNGRVVASTKQTRYLVNGESTTLPLTYTVKKVTGDYSVRQLATTLDDQSITNKQTAVIQVVAK